MSDPLLADNLDVLNTDHLPFGGGGSFLLLHSDIYSAYGAVDIVYRFLLVRYLNKSSKPPIQ